jgi:hypothetical protein
MSNIEPDYVVSVNWVCSGVDGDVTASIENTSSFSQNAESVGFILYADLTEEIVLGWVQAEPNVTINAEACVQGQINSIITPPVTPQSTPLPWVS